MFNLIKNNHKLVDNNRIAFGGKYLSFLFVIILLSMAVFPTGCRLPSRKPHDISIESNSTDSKRIAGTPLEIFKKAGLHVQWRISLPMGRGAYIKGIFYHNGRLFILDDHNKLYALDGEKGIIKHSIVLADPQQMCSHPEFYQNRLIFVVGNTIVQVQETDLRIMQKTQLNFAPSTNAARSADKIFIGSDDGRFYALRLDDGIVLWQSVQPAEPTGIVTVNDDYVYFACKDGTIYVSKTDRRELIWKFATAGQVPGVLIDNGQCFLPSTDTALYCLEPKTRKLLWKYYTGGALTELPVLTEQFVYQTVAQSSLLCLDRKSKSKTGTVRWELDDGCSFLSQNGHLCYAMTLDRELTVMNNLTGKRILSLHVPDMELYASNNKDNLIFMADKSGTILAIKPDITEK